MRSNIFIEGNQHQREHHEEELNSEDLLLPWSCCVAQFLAAEEEKERKMNEPQTLANTIRHRLMAKNQVNYDNRLFNPIQGRQNWGFWGPTFARSTQNSTPNFLISRYARDP